MSQRIEVKQRKDLDTPDHGKNDNITKERILYDILIESDFSNLSKAMNAINVKNKRICIVTETTVGPFYCEAVRNILKDIAKEVIVFQFTAGEASKTLNTVQMLYTVLTESQFDRNDMLIALGGGVVGDLTGYAAATYLRGISFVQIPTSLLAQVDSSIGGKTGVDFDCYKNMIGAFHQPKLVYINLSTLKTLNRREYLSGMGEIIKHGLIKDKKYYKWLVDHYSDIIELDMDTLEQMISHSVNIKREVVENDPQEQGERALLNFGHTLGHAIERLVNFSLLHGECVGLGVIAASYISFMKGYITESDYQDIINTNKLFELPITFENLGIFDIIETTFLDKKMDSGIIKFILLESIGNAIIDKTVTPHEMEEALIHLKELG